MAIQHYGDAAAINLLNDPQDIGQVAEAPCRHAQPGPPCKNRITQLQLPARHRTPSQPPSGGRVNQNSLR